MSDIQNNVMTASNASSEIIYGSSGKLNSSEDTRVSEKVQVLAASIYKEFEAMIQKNGEDCVKNLMPLVVNVLEGLDLAYLEKEEYSVDLEMLKEDNEQLITQYEREKQLRRIQDQKCIELEDSLMEQIKELESKVESLESITRMLELKAKNAADHAARLEEREADQKLEFDKLHERYNVLFRTHIDYMERTKYLMGNDKFEMMQNMPLPSQHVKNRMGMTTSVDTGSIRGVTDIISAHMSQSITMDVNLANHISNEADWQDEFGQSVNEIFLASRDEVSSVNAESQRTEPGDNFVEQVAKSNAESNNDINNDEEDSLGADLTGALVDPAEFASAVNDTFIGMGREVENLIKENSELLETKNALNIVKNDLIARVDELSSEQDILREEVRSHEMVRAKMAERVKELETENRELKAKLDEKTDDEDGIPMAQRKRFTRLEMARVLMERNQYKECFMELQEAIKWTELQRAKRSKDLSTRKSGGIWEFFSGLFSNDTTQRNTVRQRRSMGSGGSDPLSRRKPTKAVDFIDTDVSSVRRAAERRNQYKIVREHLRKEDNERVQAYGWSLPSSAAEQNEFIPVPVYCRQLMDNSDSLLKIWCASSVILRGGRTRDGGFIVGHSVFYSDVKTPPKEIPPEDKPEAIRDRLDTEKVTLESSSLLWICSSNQGRSQVTVLDSTSPNNVIDVFPVCSAHVLCVTSVPGVHESDYPPESNVADEIKDGNAIKNKRPEEIHLKNLPSDIIEQEDFGAVHWVELLLMEEEEGQTPIYYCPNQKPSPNRTRDLHKELKKNTEQMNIAANNVRNVRNYIPLEKLRNSAEKISEFDQQRRGRIPSHIQDGMRHYEGISDNMTALPTMWMGTQNEYILIHSGVSNWKMCLLQIKMPDAVLSILHFKGRVFAALANGSIAVFHRNEFGGWSTSGFNIIKVGKETSSVRTLIVVGGRIWAAYRNCIVVINPDTLAIEKVFAAHPRRDSQIRHMQWVGDGVWISIRLDSTLRLYHAFTYNHLQDVDIEPYVTSLLGTNRLDYSYLRTTALLVSCKRLWIGTGTGVVISVPLDEGNGRVESKVMVQSSMDEVRGPGGLIRVYSDLNHERVSPGTFMPYCDMSKAQLSFHGHKDSVKFFLAVPGMESTLEQISGKHAQKMLIISGGDGYIDFRLGEDDELILSDGVRPRDVSYLLVWEVDSNVTLKGIRE